MFDITAASEVMAVLCLSESVVHMKHRLAEIIVAYDQKGNPVRARDLKAQGAMALLLWHALKPNLVQTLEGGPAFVHGGPFANLAHGCNSLVATHLAMKLFDYTVTEAGFGSDLGAEKFFDIKCREGKLKPAAVVLVVTQQAIEKHGYENVAKHIENIQFFGLPLVIAINCKKKDSVKETHYIQTQCSKFNLPCVTSEVWEKGGKGGVELAKQVIDLCKQESKFKYLYPIDLSIKEKLETIAAKIYGADGVNYTEEALKDLELLERIGFTEVPVCVAKTQYSLSDDPKAFGRPKGFMITVRELKPSAGASFVVAYTGAIMTMPGLPKHPAAENMDITEEGKITGLF
jgi:formate--tetrahydrofolate ligase